MSVDKTTPSVLESWAGEVHEGAGRETDESVHLPTRIARYSKAKKQSIEMADYISELAASCDDLLTPDKKYLQGLNRENLLLSGFDGGLIPSNVNLRKIQLSELAVKLNDCASYLLFKHYYTAGKVRLAQAYFCKKHTLCQMCAIRRGAKSLKAYMDRYEVVKAENPALVLSMVTLTIANGDDLKERFNHLKNSFTKYLNQRRDSLKKNRGFNELSKIEGAIYSYEITNKGKGWHPHIHLLALTKMNNRVDKYQLSKEWEKITGDSYIVHETNVTSLDDQDQSSGFMEVLKYSMKFSELTKEQVFYAHETLMGSRMMGCFGLFYNVKIPDDLLDEPLDELPYIEMIYKYYRGKGYSINDAGQVTLEAKNSSGEP